MTPDYGDYGRLRDTIPGTQDTIPGTPNSGDTTEFRGEFRDTNSGDTILN